LFLGVNLRTPLLAVPPLLALIRSDLHLTYGETGLLTALPSLLMGLGAWPAGRIAGRIGGRRAVSLGLAVVTLGTVARGVWPSAIGIYVFTIALAAGIALAQTSVPLLARQWFPSRIGFVSAIFTDGLTLGETFGASLTVPLMSQWFGANAWPAALLMWAIPLTAMLLLWMMFAPPTPLPSYAMRGSDSNGQPSGSAHAEFAAPHVSPWMIGAIMGGGSVVYFGMNGWVASYNEALRASAVTPLALFAINAAQLPICFGLTLVAQRLAGKRWPFVAAGCLSFASILGWLVTPPSLEPLWGTLIGASSATVFTLAIALPAIFAHGAHVARLTGASLGVSYTSTFIGPYIGGVLWDWFQLPWLAFAPVLISALILVCAALLLPDPPTDRGDADASAARTAGD
jgi:CP family cyanate transporter-like MFS transporter